MPDGASGLESSFPALRAWYRRCGRTLPWRERGVTPYDVLLSEYLLQQTQVITALPYYERLKSRFPTIERLAAAPLADVLDLWAGLGYYRRARHLHEAAAVIAESHGGRVPQSETALRALPGVGAYTAGAIRAFAFNLPGAAVDANIERVLARALALQESRTTLAQRLLKLLPDGAAGEINAALMELGALVCLPKAPKCDRCPLQSVCAAHAQGRQEAFPARKPPPARQRENLTIAVVAVHGGVLSERRPPRGLLGGMMGLPTFAELPDWLLPQRQLGDLTQIYSHRVWHARIVTATLAAEPPPTYAAIPTENLADCGYARIYRRALDLWLAEEGFDDDAASGLSKGR